MPITITDCSPHDPQHEKQTKYRPSPAPSSKIWSQNSWRAVVKETFHAWHNKVVCRFSEAHCSWAKSLSSTLPSYSWPHTTAKLHWLSNTARKQTFHRNTAPSLKTHSLSNTRWSWFPPPPFPNVKQKESGTETKQSWSCQGERSIHREGENPWWRVSSPYTWQTHTEGLWGRCHAALRGPGLQFSHLIVIFPLGWNTKQSRTSIAILFLKCKELKLSNKFNCFAETQTNREHKCSNSSD